MIIKRGQLIWCDFEGSYGSRQGGKRPAVVVQNNTGNRFSTTTIVIPLTSREKTKLPVHTKLTKDYDIAYKGNIMMAEQLTVIDKSQIISTGGMLDKEDLNALDRIIAKQLSLHTKGA
jgi:mRNA interferase MazF